MGLFTEKYDSPFDNEQTRRKIDDKVSAVSAFICVCNGTVYSSR